uniref:Reverse transcriptase zinc-binding domain-containing protein n=1 Tax=Lactuca sativa TaxID=4236 RepID=A0A9R1WC76_LACSA|nr:hypothetical protein LSAT_V11C200095260 [Lactuca sativa]
MVRKRCKVADIIIDGCFVGHWNSCPVESGLYEDLDNLMNELSTVNLASGRDQWKSKLDVDGRYTVGALRRLIDKKSVPSQMLPPMLWHKDAPIKVNFFIWRALQNKIPSMMALRSRGVELDSTCCGACFASDECANPILVTCPYASAIRDKLFDWCGIKHQTFHNVRDLICFATSWGRCSKKKKKKKAHDDMLRAYMEPLEI